MTLAYVKLTENSPTHPEKKKNRTTKPNKQQQQNLKSSLSYAAHTLGSTFLGSHGQSHVIALIIQHLPGVLCGNLASVAGLC